MLNKTKRLKVEVRDSTGGHVRTFFITGEHLCATESILSELSSKRKRLLGSPISETGHDRMIPIPVRRLKVPGE